MCIFFLPPECPFPSTTNGPTRKSSLPFNTSLTNVQSLPSSTSSRSSRSSSNSLSCSDRSLIYSFSSDISRDSLYDSGLPINPLHPYTSPSQQIREYVFSDDKEAVQIGRCIAPTSASPLICHNFQARHRPSPSNYTGYFDKCLDCTKAGAEILRDLNDRLGDTQKDEIEAEAIEEICEMCGVVKKEVQIINRASFGSCDNRECKSCKADGKLVI